MRSVFRIMDCSAGLTVSVPLNVPNSRSCTGKTHREGLSVAVRSMTYGAVLPRKSSVTTRTKVSSVPICDQNWAQKMLPRPLLVVMSSRDKVVQANLAVEGVSVYVLSTLPNLLSVNTAAPMKVPLTGPTIDDAAAGGQQGSNDHQASTTPWLWPEVLQPHKLLRHYLGTCRLDQT